MQTNPQPAGAGVNPLLIANSLLRRSFNDNIPLTPLKIQKLLYITASLYQRRTGRRLLCESFQAWKTGPVCRSVHDKFRDFGATPIPCYARNATGNAYAADEDASPVLQHVLDEVWSSFAELPPSALVRLVCGRGGVWRRTVEVVSTRK